MPQSIDGGSVFCSARTAFLLVVLHLKRLLMALYRCMCPYHSVSLVYYSTLPKAESEEVQEQLAAVEEELHQEKEGHREDVEALQQQLADERSVVMRRKSVDAVWFGLV